MRGGRLYNEPIVLPGRVGVYTPNGRFARAGERRGERSGTGEAGTAEGLVIRYEPGGLRCMHPRCYHVGLRGGLLKWRGRGRPSLAPRARPLLCPDAVGKALRQRYSTGMDIRTMALAVLVIAGGIAAVNVSIDGVGANLTHGEFMRLSGGEARGLRICQRQAIFTQMEERYGSRPPELGRSKAKAWAEYEKLVKAQQREGQPTSPEFVDPGDPPSFQETMWQKGYRCTGDDWNDFVLE